MQEQLNPHCDEWSRVAGVVVPGMPNAHSHAFQRAMAGNAEYRTGVRDSFWTWRQAMYALANRIGPDDLQVVATQLFIEMLKAGYTSVAEFHYLHRVLGEASSANTSAFWDATANAARTAGIGLTFLPTLYQSGDFGSAPLKAEQRRFFASTEEFLRGIEDRVGAEHGAPSGILRTGAAFPGLRAVPWANTAACRARVAQYRCGHAHSHPCCRTNARGARLTPGDRPACPVNCCWTNHLLTPALVHRAMPLTATASELQGIADADAVVCVSISTEANLGDGFFDAQRFALLDSRSIVRWGQAVNRR